MPFVPAPNIMMVEARALLFGQQIENRFMCNNQGPVTLADLEAAAVAVWNWWELAYAVALPITVNLVEVLATDLTVQNGAQFTYAPDATTNGTVAGGQLPNECSVCVSLRSAVRGRSARGRFYTLAVPLSFMADENNITVAYQNQLAATGVSLRDNLAAIAPLTIVSFFSNGILRPGGPVYFPVINALVVDRVVDSMRRRKPGVGS